MKIRSKTKFIPRTKSDLTNAKKNEKLEENSVDHILTQLVVS